MIELDVFTEETLKSVVRGIKRVQDDSELGQFVAPLLQGEKRNDFGNVPIEIPTFRSKDDHTEKSSPLTSRTSSEGHATGPFRPRESF
jgi:hypothetical protein